MTTRWHVILLDRATNDERQAVHEIIKSHANGWWHRHLNTWIVGGLTAQQWRDTIKDCLLPGPSNILILSLPKEEIDRNWSYYGSNSKEKCGWLHDNIK